MMAHRDVDHLAARPDAVDLCGIEYCTSFARKFRAVDPDDALARERPR